MPKETTQPGCKKGVPHTAWPGSAQGCEEMGSVTLPQSFLSYEGNEASDRSNCVLCHVSATNTVSKADENLTGCAVLRTTEKFLSR